MLARVLACVTLTCGAWAQVEVLQLTGASAGDAFGASIAFVGDVDVDGHEDFVVGAPRNDAAGPDVGSVSLYSGRTSQLLRSWTGIVGERYFGSAIAAVGDLDGDGVSDLLIGAAGKAELGFAADVVVPGYAQLFSGASGALLHTFTGSGNPRRFGYALAGGRDLNGDGVGELLIGAPGDGTDTGYVYVFDGVTFDQVRRDGDARGIGFGFPLEFLGDIDGDGIEDYVSGASTASNFGQSSNGGWVFALDGATGLGVWATHGFVDSQMGWSVARIGDYDGDTHADLVVGLRGKGGSWIACQNWSQLRVLSGDDGALLQVNNDLHPCSAWGTAVAAVGDLDGDGVVDYAGAGPGWYVDFDFAEPVRVFRCTQGSLLAKLVSPTANPSGYSVDAWGYAIAAGDVNGDGLPDLAVGAPYVDVTGTNAGAVYVYSVVRFVRSYCTASINSQGCSPSIAGSGVPSVSSGLPFVISATDVLNQKIGFLFYGYAPQAKPYFGGLRCVAPPTRRTPNQLSGGNPPSQSDCTGTHGYDFNARIASGVDPALIAGAEVFAQYWMRDPQSASTVALSDALAFDIHL